jgi:hypothetical protein
VSGTLREQLVAEGWQERFSAAGPRLQEAADYYESLGYEVRVEDLLDTAADEACTTCFVGDGIEGRVGVIFTRGERAAVPDDDLFEQGLPG